MFENIRLLYRFYGGISGVFASGYFWVALVLTSALGVLSEFGPWYEITHTTLPSLAGFSIAAFAIIFVVLKPEQISALMRSRDKADKPPLLSVGSAICHAILIQVLTILFAGLVMSVNQEGIIALFCGSEPLDICWKLFSTGKWLLDFVGYFLLFYSWLLVLAAALSVLRMMALAGNVR